jgi:hypothetical protein
MSERVRSLPFHREEGHLANARRLVVAVVAGELDRALELAAHFREGWERAGRPRAGNLSRGAYAAATVYGLRGDDATRAEWLEIVAAIVTPGRRVANTHFGEFFDAMLWLHRGLTETALHQLEMPPEHFRDWHNGMWKPWYAGLWAEAAAVATHPDALARIERARVMTIDNPIAATIVDRAAATLAGDRDGLRRAAAGFEAAGCHYQWARTLVLIGGEDRPRGEAAMAAMGTTPMVWPPARC